MAISPNINTREFDKFKETASGDTAVKSSESGVGVQNQLSGTATDTSTLVLAENTDRTYLLIQNTGSNNLYVKFISSQSAGEGILIIAGGNFEPERVPTDAVYLIAEATTTTSYVILEG